MAYSEKRAVHLDFNPRQIMELMGAIHEKGAGFRLVARGRSMHPFIQDGDALIVSSIRGMAPFLGEVVLADHRQSKRIVVHRVVYKDRDGYLTYGDNNRYSDGILPVDQILGVITRVERGGRAIFWPNRFRFTRLARIYFFFIFVFIKVWRKGTRFRSAISLRKK